MTHPTSNEITIERRITELSGMCEEWTKARNAGRPVTHLQRGLLQIVREIASVADETSTDDLGDQIHALLVRRGYAQHEAHLIAGGPGCISDCVQKGYPEIDCPKHGSLAEKASEHAHLWCRTSGEDHWHCTQDGCQVTKPYQPYAPPAEVEVKRCPCGAVDGVSMHKPGCTQNGSKVNRLLREHNTAIDLCDTINMKTGNFERRMWVPTVRIDKKKRKGPIRVFATFCPMCGEKYPEREGATSPVSESAP